MISAQHYCCVCIAFGRPFVAASRWWDGHPRDSGLSNDQQSHHFAHKWLLYHAWQEWRVKQVMNSKCYDGNYIKNSSRYQWFFSRFITLEGLACSVPFRCELRKWSFWQSEHYHDIDLGGKATGLEKRDSVHHHSSRYICQYQPRSLVVCAQDDHGNRRNRFCRSVRMIKQSKSVPVLVIDDASGGSQSEGHSITRASRGSSMSDLLCLHSLE